MKNINIKYFMVLTVFILGLGDVPLQATNAKMNSSSTAQKMSQSSGKVNSLSAQQRKDLTDAQNAILKAQKELKQLQTELPNPKDPKAKQTSNVNPKDLASSLTCVQELQLKLKKIQDQLPGAQKAGQMMAIKSSDLAKAIDTTKDAQAKMKLLQKSLDGTKKSPNSNVVIQSTAAECGLAVAIVLLLLFIMLGSLLKMIEAALAIFVIPSVKQN